MSSARCAFERGREKLVDEVNAFREANKWVDNYGLYMALKGKFDMLPWTEWPDEDIRMHRDSAVRYWSEFRINRHGCRFAGTTA